MTSNGIVDDLDADIVIDPNRPVRISPEAMRAVKAATGTTFTDLLQDEDPSIQFQVAAFAALHKRAVRLGHMPPAAELWERAAAVDLVFETPAELDPTNGASSTISPPSVVTGE